jgi:hypothetical protein
MKQAWTTPVMMMSGIGHRFGNENGKAFANTIPTIA